MSKTTVLTSWRAGDVTSTVASIGVQTWLCPWWVGPFSGRWPHDLSMPSEVASEPQPVFWTQGLRIWWSRPWTSGPVMSSWLSCLACTRWGKVSEGHVCPECMPVCTAHTMLCLGGGYFWMLSIMKNGYLEATGCLGVGSPCWFLGCAFFRTQPNERPWWRGRFAFCSGFSPEWKSSVSSSWVGGTGCW